LNPHALAGAATSRLCVCQFRHLRNFANTYFLDGGGAAGLPPGRLGVTLTGGAPVVDGFAPAGRLCFVGVLRSSTVPLLAALRVARIESAIEVHMNTIAEIVVAFESSVAEPRGPKAVCDPIPPNAPARSAAFPLCSRITMIRNRQTTT
jgi:hypothetical protein